MLTIERPEPPASADAPDSLDTLRQLREQRLRRTVNLCAAAHPYYRRRFAQLGIRPDDIRTLDDLQRVPLLKKSDYMAAPDEFRLQLAEVDGCSLEERTLWNVVYTTGTTSGRPSPVFNSTHDQFNILLQSRIGAEAEGFLPTDTLANLIPISSTPTGGFYGPARTAEALGIPVVHAFTGAKNTEYPIHRSLDEAIDLLSLSGASIFHGIPSFVRRFFRRVRERGVAFPRARMIIVSGEPVSQAMEAELHEHLRHLGCEHPQVRMRYAFTEMQCGFVKCCNEAVAQNVVPHLYYFEVVDPDTGVRMSPGEEGALAITHLHRRGTVLLRYLIGDVVTLQLDRCPHCGRLGERLLTSPRRTGALLKVKGMLVNPEIVFNMLSAEPGVKEFQLVVRNSIAGDPDSPDELALRLEAVPGAQERLAQELPSRIKTLVQVTPAIEFAPPGELFDPMKTTKAKRVIDARLPR